MGFKYLQGSLKLLGPLLPVSPPHEGYFLIYNLIFLLLQLLSSCHISVPFQEQAHSVFSILSLWGTGKHSEVCRSSVCVPATKTCSSMSKLSCSGGLTNPAGRGRITSLDLLAVLLLTQPRLDVLGLCCKGILLTQVLLAVCQDHQVLFFFSYF